MSVKINTDAPRNNSIYGQDGHLLNCCVRPTKCGCEVIGDGTIQHPITVKFCDKHSEK